MAGAYRTTNPHLRKAMLKVFGNKCFYTGQEVTKDNMAIDHVIPRSKGGEDSVFNYVLTTKFINGQKRDAIEPDRLEAMLYSIRTVYAPRVLRTLKGKNNNEPSLTIPIKTYNKFKNLKYSSIYVYIIFLEQSEKSEVFEFTALKARKEYGMATSTFIQAIDELEKEGLITVINKGSFPGKNKIRSKGRYSLTA